MTKVDLITGILGSGKTTFIRKYADYLIKKGEKTAILENDFGAVNIDMVMLQDLKCENCQLEMIAGGGDSDCHKRRFKTQLISLGMQNLDRVIIEPSGIFDMDEFFDTLYESPLDRWFSIGSVLTIVDVNTDEKLSKQMEYLFASEAACCGKIILSKINQLKDGECLNDKKESVLNHLNNSLEKINCHRKFTEKDVFCTDWEKLSEKDFDMLLSSGYRGESYVKLFTNDDIKSGVHYFMHIKLKEDVIEKIVENIFRDSECGKIFRIKGSIQNSKGEWLKVNATPEKTDIETVENGQAVFIVIGDDVNKNAVDKYFQEYNTDSEYVSI